MGRGVLNTGSLKRRPENQDEERHLIHRERMEGFKGKKHLKVDAVYLKTNMKTFVT